MGAVRELLAEGASTKRPSRRSPSAPASRGPRSTSTTARAWTWSMRCATRSPPTPRSSRSRRPSRSRIQSARWRRRSDARFASGPRKTPFSASSTAWRRSIPPARALVERQRADRRSELERLARKLRRRRPPARGYDRAPRRSRPPDRLRSRPAGRPGEAVVRAVDELSTQVRRPTARYGRRSVLCAARNGASNELCPTSQTPRPTRPPTNHRARRSPAAPTFRPDRAAAADLRAPGVQRRRGRRGAARRRGVAGLILVVLARERRLGPVGSGRGRPRRRCRRLRTGRPRDRPLRRRQRPPRPSSTPRRRAGAVKLALAHQDGVATASGHLPLEEPARQRRRIQDLVRLGAALRNHPELEALSLIALVRAPELAAFHAHVAGDPYKPPATSTTRPRHDPGLDPRRPRRPIAGGPKLTPNGRRFECLPIGTVGRSAASQPAGSFDVCSANHVLLATRDSGQSLYSDVSAAGGGQALEILTPIYRSNVLPRTATPAVAPPSPAGSARCSRPPCCCRSR